MILALAGMSNGTHTCSYCCSVKLGMLANKDIVACVAQKLSEYSIQNIVVDPVMVATSGDVLLKRESIENMKSLLFPITTVVTPNIPEAIQLSQMKQINSVDDMITAAKIISKYKPKFVLIKGGHLNLEGSGDSEVTDVLYDVEKDEIHKFKSEEVVSNNTHGTGCTLAACIAAEISKGASVVDAVRSSKQYLTTILKASASSCIGKGHGPLLHHLSR